MLFNKISLAIIIIPTNIKIERNKIILIRKCIILIAQKIIRKINLTNSKPKENDFNQFFYDHIRLNITFDSKN